MKSLPNTQTPKYQKNGNRFSKYQGCYLKSIIGILFFMLLSLGMQAQTYNLILQNKSSCNALVNYSVCGSPNIYTDIVPSYSTLPTISLVAPPTNFEGSFNGSTYPFGGDFGICSAPPSIYANPDACYTTHALKTIVPLGGTTDFYITFY